MPQMPLTAEVEYDEDSLGTHYPTCEGQLMIQQATAQIRWTLHAAQPTLAATPLAEDELTSPLPPGFSCRVVNY